MERRRSAAQAKTIVKVCEDVLMMVMLLLLMAYEMIRQAAHEWLGIIISRSVLTFLPITGWQSFGRNLHMISAYWGFVLMSLHLGLHWSMMMQSHFMLFDYEEPLLLFLADYVAAMASDKICTQA